LAEWVEIIAQRLKEFKLPCQIFGSLTKKKLKIVTKHARRQSLEWLHFVKNCELLGEKILRNFTRN